MQRYSKLVHSVRNHFLPRHFHPVSSNYLFRTKMSHQHGGHEAEGAGHCCQHKPMVVGGHSQAKEATEDAQNKADAVRSEVEKQLGGPVKKYEVKQYKTQVVAGSNYSMKIEIDDGKFIHIRVFVPLGNGAPQLSGIEKDKASGDEIGHISNLE